MFIILPDIVLPWLGLRNRQNHGRQNDQTRFRNGIQREISISQTLGDIGCAYIVTDAERCSFYPCSVLAIRANNWASVAASGKRLECG